MARYNLLTGSISALWVVHRPVEIVDSPLLLTGLNRTIGTVCHNSGQLPVPGPGWPRRVLAR